MEVRILTPLTTLQATPTQTTTVCLLGSWLKDLLRMAGPRMSVVTTVQPVILIGQTGHTKSSLPIWRSGSSNHGYIGRFASHCKLTEEWYLVKGCNVWALGNSFAFSDFALMIRDSFFLLRERLCWAALFWLEYLKSSRKSFCSLKGILKVLRKRERSKIGNRKNALAYVKPVLC